MKGLEMAKKEVWVKVIAYNWAQAIIFFVFVAGYMRHLSSFSPYLLRDFSNTLSSSGVCSKKERTDQG
ncbi:MAG: hypothetical protein DRP30_03690 [Thermotoga sp.]|nr:MAG: hypothetical protein DRP30_03690 [Thermotoga sp.]